MPESKAERNGRTIARVIVWQNGMVMVFDELGHQMPEHQGAEEEVMGSIRAVYAGPIERHSWPKQK